MGVVYKVRHSVLDTILALKVLPEELMGEEEMVRRFYREARVMARLNQPNIVRVLDIDQDEGLNIHYFVMEHIKGRTFGQYLQESGPLPLQEILEFAYQVSQALAYAHGHSPPIIHRDIKPSNIMIEETTDRVVVMDFGIAKELGGGEDTESGTMMGTLRYCPPEQLRQDSQESLGGSADIYALGMVLYEAYAGKPFFTGLSENAIIGRVLGAEKNEPHFSRPTPPEFVQLITKAIAKSRAQRYRSIEDFLSDLDACWKTFGDQTVRLLTQREQAQPSSPEEAEEESDGPIDEVAAWSRKQVLATKTQALEARKRAAQAGADSWALDLLQEGLAHEESGNQKLREKSYTPALEAYQRAVASFTQATEQAAVAARQHQAEQARQAMAASKSEAEKYGARERARTFYGRGLSLQAQADELWEEHTYQRAQQLYEEARNVFDDARELAYRASLKEEAVVARSETQHAKQSAVDEQAERYAAQAVQMAGLREQQAEAAFQQEEFSHAAELFRQARQQYDEAYAQAGREKLYQNVQAAQQQAEKAQRYAQATKAEKYAEARYHAAAECLRQGRMEFEAEAYEQASVTFTTASEYYRQAAQEAEKEQQRRAAVAARERGEELRGEVLQGDGEEFLTGAFEEAQQLFAQGQAYEQQEDFGRALGAYERAAEQFRQARKEAELGAKQAAAEQALQQVQALRSRSTQLREWVPQGWDAADTSLEKATRSWEQGAYSEVIALASHARQQYEEAEEQAQAEKVRIQREAALLRMQEVRSAAEQAAAPEHAASTYQRAVQIQTDAEQMTVEHFGQAATRFAEAEALFQQALQEAEQGKERRAAATALAQSESAYEDAKQAGADARFPDRFEAATQELEQGRTRFDQEDLAQAKATLEQATQSLLRLCQDAIIEQNREKAEAFRQKVEEAQQSTQALQAFAQEHWQAARETVDRAEKFYLAQQYERAAQDYERALEAYANATQVAEVEQLEKEADAAQQAVREARTAAENEAAPRYSEQQFARGEEAFEEAEQLRQAQDLPQATQAYRRAAELFHQAAEVAQQEQLVQMTDEMAAQAATEQAKAEEVGANELFPEGFAQALEHFEQGRARQEQGDFQHAQEAFAQATQQCVQVQTEVAQHRAREQVEAAQQEAEQARQQTASLASQWAPKHLKAAEDTIAEARQAWHAQEYEHAAQAYKQAVQAYQEAQIEAETAQQQHQAQEARQQALQQQQAADKLLAAELTPDEYQQGREAFLQGEQALSEEEWLTANEQFTQAATLLDEAAQSAALLQAEQAADTEREKALHIRQKASDEGAAEVFSERFAQAQTVFERGETTLEQQDFATAQAHFEESVEAFQDLYEEALTLTQKEQAALVHTQAQALQQQLSGVRGFKKRSAGWSLWVGERCFRKGQYVKAFQYYEKALAQLVALEAGVVASEEKSQAEPAHGNGGTLPGENAEDYQEPAHGEALSPVADGDEPTEFLGPPPVHVADATKTVPADKPPVDSVESARREDVPPENAESAQSESRDELNEQNEPDEQDELHPTEVLSAPPANAGDEASVSGGPDEIERQGEPVAEAQPQAASSLYPPSPSLSGRSRTEWLQRAAIPIALGGALLVAGLGFFFLNSESTKPLPPPPPVSPPLPDETLPPPPRPQQSIFQHVAGLPVTFDLAVSGVTQALLDGAASDHMTLAEENRVGVVLPEVPIGESSYQLDLTYDDGSSQIYTLNVTYYPDWEVQKIVNAAKTDAVTFSPDGTLILSGGRDNVMKLWQGETGEHIRAFRGHRNWVRSAAFSPDQKTVLSGSRDGTLRLWDIETGRRIRTLSGHKKSVNTVRFSPDGQWILSGSDDQRIKLWEAETGKEVKSFSGHTGWVLSVAFSPDGRSVLSGSDDKTLRLWDVESGETVQTFIGHEDSVSAVTFSPDGQSILSGSDDKTLRLWDVGSGETVQIFIGHDQRVYGVDFGPDGKRVVSGSMDTTVRLWDVESGTEVRTFQGHENPVTSVAFSPDGKTALAGGRDGTLIVWWAGVSP